MSAARNGTYYVLDAETGELISSDAVGQAGVVRSEDGLPGVVVNGVEDCKGNCFGVRNWWPMSYDPITQLTYVPIMDRRRTSPPTPDALPMVGGAWWRGIRRRQPRAGASNIS